MLRFIKNLFRRRQTADPTTQRTIDVILDGSRQTRTVLGRTGFGLHVDDGSNGSQFVLSVHAADDDEFWRVWASLGDDLVLVDEDGDRVDPRDILG